MIELFITFVITFFILQFCIYDSERNRHVDAVKRRNKYDK